MLTAKQWIALLVMTSFSGHPAYAAELTSVDFRVDGDTSWIEISSDSPLTYTQSENSGDKQIIIDLTGAKIGASASRKLDTSSFNSPVVLVSPYQVGDQARVVIQLREMTQTSVVQEGNLIKVAVNKAALQPQSQAAAAPEAPPEDKKNPLDEFAAGRDSNQFKGTPITLQVRDAEVTDVLRLIGEASGFNIVVGDGVKGKITLSLVDVPWDQALDVVLNTMKLGAERNKNILRVTTLANLTSEKQEILRAKQAAEASSPRITRVFSISYADPTSLEKLLTTFGKGGAGGGGSVATVQLDARTNSIVVQDIPENIERMAKLIEILDTQTPQVMVEAKIVEASEQFSRTIGGSLGMIGETGLSSNQRLAFLGSFAGGNPADPLIGVPGVFADGARAAASTTGSGSIGLSPRFSFLPGLNRLNAFLTMGESDQTVKIISSPKTVVINKEAATILQSTPVVITTTVNDGGVTTTQKQILQANVSLKVTPTVTNDGSVMMKLEITRDIPTVTATNDQAVANRNMTTTVLVDSGSTLVIGGIYVMDKTIASSGFPFLRKIPLLGTLFGSENDQESKSELFIFVTPTIINTKKAGLSG